MLLTIGNPGDLFDAGDAPVLEKWQSSKDESIRRRVYVLLANLLRLEEYASRHPQSAAARMLDDAVGRQSLRFIPRFMHKWLLIQAVTSIANIVATGMPIASERTRVVYGPKGIGKSFLMKLIVIGSSLCLPDDADGTILLGYVSAPMFHTSGSLLLLPDLLCELAKRHGLLHDDAEATTFLRDPFHFLGRNQAVPVLIVDEVDAIYLEQPGDTGAFIQCLRNWRETGHPAMFWITGSAGALRMMAEGVAPESQSFPGYRRSSKLQYDKFLAVQLHNRISFYQSLLMLVNATRAATRGRGMQELVSDAEEYLRRSMSDAIEEESREDLQFDLFDKDDSNINPWEVSFRLRAEPENCQRGPLDMAEVFRKAHLLLWNSCGLARHYELLGKLSDEPGALQQLRSAMAHGNDFGRFLHDLAEAFETEVPTVLNPLCVLSDQGFKCFPLSIVTKGRSPTSDQLMKWSTEDYLFIDCQGSGMSWRVGFRHPRFAAEAIAIHRHELGGMNLWQRMSMVFPFGKLGQGFPETMALEAMRNGGLQFAIETAPGREGERPRPDEVRRFSLVSDVRLDLADPASWDRNIVQRIQEGGWVIVPTKPLQRGVDGVAFWAFERDEAVHRGVGFVEIKLAGLFDAVTFERTTEHPDVPLRTVQRKLHLAWAEWGKGICERLGWDFDTTVPWFILETCKRVPSKEEWSRWFAGENRSSAPPVAPPSSESAAGAGGDDGDTRGVETAERSCPYNLRPRLELARIIHEAVTEEEEEDREVNAIAETRDALTHPAGMFGCILDQADLYAYWPVQVRKLAEILNLAPEYIEPDSGKEERSAPNALDMYDDAAATGSLPESPFEDRTPSEYNQRSHRRHGGDSTQPAAKRGRMFGSYR